MSPSLLYFARRVMGPVLAPNHVRLLGTRRLLTTTDLHEDTIAERSGFPRASNFRQAFVRQYGVSPSDYRRGMRAESAAGITPSV